MVEKINLWIRLTTLLFVFLGIFACQEEHKGKYINYSRHSSGERITINYKESSYDKSKEMFIDVEKKVKVDPKKSALVLIDVWQLKFLDSITINYLNPLINEADSLGMKIIYSPSQAPQNKHLNLLEDAVYFYDHDMMDKYLLDNNIENLFYVGFDTFYCVLDKPNGIVSYRARNNNELQIFLLEDGVLSFNEGNKNVAIELLKRNNVGIVKSDIYKNQSHFPNKTSQDTLTNQANEVAKGKNLIVIFKKDEVDPSLENFENKLKLLGLDYGVVQDGKLVFKNKEISPFNFVKLIKEEKINNIYYCGYHLNNEILLSDYGFISLYIKKRYNLIKMPRIHFITDLSYMVASEGISKESEKLAIINNERGLYNIKSNIFLEGVQK